MIAKQVHPLKRINLSEKSLQVDFTVPAISVLTVNHFNVAATLNGTKNESEIKVSHARHVMVAESIENAREYVVIKMT